ncbi:hypothetical protein [Singulisphaera sp. GP187]|uniref:hypothetical protein n=1 Tax=Singulisphaera sp. GP187 TaxID=1882752 RepID=UPI0013562C44|nr:hypothetical protein [Singulisphaera sp. GP187]
MTDLLAEISHLVGTVHPGVPIAARNGNNLVTGLAVSAQRGYNEPGEFNHHNHFAN